MSEELILRARALLHFLGEVGAYEQLVGTGINSGLAFLAVKAAKLL
jgi:hypothetical protein